MARRGWRSRVGVLLMRWGAALQPPSSGPAVPVPAGDTAPAVPPPDDGGPEPPQAPRPDRRRAAPLAKRPGVRPPLSVERAVLSRDLAVLKREATDALAALGAAHAVVTSARLAQVQNVRSEVQAGRIAEDDLVELAGDYQAWQNDQVRLFDALALVLGMPVPEGRAFDQIDASLTAPARAHLSALAAEYQRRLLSDQFSAGDKEG
ncbi:hypothetical protein KBY76_14170 [Synechococcus sp. GreenBA-s]|nr:hypothetical protein [Synechococcus sp. GreenBA-s]